MSHTHRYKAPKEKALVIGGNAAASAPTIATDSSSGRQDPGVCMCVFVVVGGGVCV